MLTCLRKTKEAGSKGNTIFQCQTAYGKQKKQGAKATTYSNVRLLTENKWSREQKTAYGKQKQQRAKATPYSNVGLLMEIRRCEQRQHHKRRVTIKPSRLYRRRLAVRWIYGERIAWTCWQGVLFARRVRGQWAPNQGWEQVLSERHLCTQQRPATHRSTIKLRMTSVDLRRVTSRLTKLNQQPFPSPNQCLYKKQTAM